VFLAADEPWQERAACKSPQSLALFFPPVHAERKAEKLAREAAAKAICARCLVAKACLEYALEIEEPHGIWGGLTEQERKALIGRRAG